MNNLLFSNTFKQTLEPSALYPVSYVDLYENR